MVQREQLVVQRERPVVQREQLVAQPAEPPRRHLPRPAPARSSADRPESLVASASLASAPPPLRQVLRVLPRLRPQSRPDSSQDTYLRLGSLRAFSDRPKIAPSS